MDPLLETLEGAVQRLRQPPPVVVEVEMIREQLAEHRAQGRELEKLLPSFSTLCSRGEELIGRAAHNDPAAQAVQGGSSSAADSYGETVPPGGATVEESGAQPKLGAALLALGPFQHALGEAHTHFDRFVILSG
ncbi:hypothetical protein Q5P01_018622 [Channa striata]|uniref:Uncharacterized protein n=1 Tax=Channa striata TaxID=64152 RepID=A0AA88S9C9_CHASR|nr:hypothetical protein Q5P01_018622 [Channa striata]